MFCQNVMPLYLLMQTFFGESRTFSLETSWVNVDLLGNNSAKFPLET